VFDRGFLMLLAFSEIIGKKKKSQWTKPPEKGQQVSLSFPIKHPKSSPSGFHPHLRPSGRNFFSLFEKKKKKKKKKNKKKINFVFFFFFWFRYLFS